MIKAKALKPLETWQDIYDLPAGSLIVPGHTAQAQLRHFNTAEFRKDAVEGNRTVYLMLAQDTFDPGNGRIFDLYRFLHPNGERRPYKRRQLAPGSTYILIEGVDIWTF